MQERSRITGRGRRRACRAPLRASRASCAPDWVTTSRLWRRCRRNASGVDAALLAGFRGRGIARSTIVRDPAATPRPARAAPIIRGLTPACGGSRGSSKIWRNLPWAVPPVARRVSSVTHATPIPCRGQPARGLSTRLSDGPVRIFQLEIDVGIGPVTTMQLAYGNQEISWRGRIRTFNPLPAAMPRSRSSAPVRAGVPALGPRRGRTPRLRSSLRPIAHTGARDRR